MRLYNIFLTFLIFSSLFGSKQIDTIFGSYEIDDPIIEELIDSKVMQRLKNIDQSGVPYYLGYVSAFDRFSHSVGVYYLLKKVNAPHKEQVAGLLHDASHTVFSHLGDYLFQDTFERSYHDGIHKWYLKNVNIQAILDEYNLTLKDILPKENDYLALDQGLPDMCADRIEYNLHTALMFNMFTKEKVKEIISNIRYKRGKWYFTDVKLAKEFAKLSLEFTEKFWGGDWNFVIQQFYSEILLRAKEIGLVTLEDVHFKEDKEIFDRILSSNDESIKELLLKCWCASDYYEVVTSEPFDYIHFPKFRGIDPLVSYHNKLVRLTSIDNEFRKEFLRVKEYTVKGIKIRLKNFSKKAA